VTHHSLALVVGTVAVISLGGGAGAQQARLLSQVSLDRPAPIYAVNDHLVLTIVAASNVELEIWEVSATGAVNKIVPGEANAQPLRLGAGQTLHFPPGGGRLRIEGPAGPYQLKVVARAVEANTRSLGSAGARLAGAQVRDEWQVHYKVVDPAAP
jgi:hypothetical protein